MSSSTADTVDRARARSRARGSLDDLIAKEKSQGSEQTSSAAETWTGSSPYGGVGKSKGKSKGKSEEPAWLESVGNDFLHYKLLGEEAIKGKGKDKDMAAGGKGGGGMGGNELTTEAEKEPEDYAEGDAEDGPALYQLSKPAAAGRSSRGKSKGSKRVAGGGSDSYGNTGKDGAGGGDDNDEEKENEERERTGLTRISKWEYVLMRVKDAQAKTEDALEILDKLETQLMDM